MTSVTHLFGDPQSSENGREDVHSFSPERTLIISGDQLPTTSIHPKIVERIQEDLTTDATPYSSEGICQIVQAAYVLTHAYGVSDQLENWSRRMANWLFRFYWSVASNHLWICPMGWQGERETAMTMNRIVDWWLILVPRGIEVPNFDGTKTHVLITPVFAEVRNPCVRVGFWTSMMKALRITNQNGSMMSEKPSHRTWFDLSQMNRVKACRFINERISKSLRSNP